MGLATVIADIGCCQKGLAGIAVRAADVVSQSTRERALGPALRPTQSSSRLCPAFPGIPALHL